MSEEGRPLFTRFVEPGRLCVVQQGNDFDKVAVIVGMINHNRVLIDGPTTGVERQPCPLRRLRLSDVKVTGIQAGCRTSTLKKKLEEQQTLSSFEDTTWGRKRAAQHFRANMSDFQRFQLLVAHKKRRALIKSKLYTSAKGVKKTTKTSPGRKAAKK